MSQSTLVRESTTTSHVLRTGGRWALNILVGALFAYSGAVKLAGDPEQVEGFEELGWGQWFRYFIGAAEVAGGIGLLIPALAALAAAGLAIIMTGAVFVHLLDDHPTYLALIPLVLGVVLVLMVRANWHRTPSALRGAFRR